MTNKRPFNSELNIFSFLMFPELGWIIFSALHGFRKVWIQLYWVLFVFFFIFKHSVPFHCNYMKNDKYIIQMFHRRMSNNVSNQK